MYESPRFELATNIFEAPSPDCLATDQEPVIQFKGAQIASGALVVNVPSHYLPIHQEIHMYTKTTIVNGWSVIAGAIVACTWFAGDVVAQGQEVTVAYHVSTHGLDLSSPAGVRELYRRLKNAAWIVCTRANRVGLEPYPSPDVCYENSLAAAIRSAHMPLLVQEYLETHSLGQAVAHRIDVPVQLAAK
jgi:UrcA family protein